MLKGKKDFAGGSGFGYDYKKETLRRLT